VSAPDARLHVGVLSAGEGDWTRTAVLPLLAGLPQLRVSMVGPVEHGAWGLPEGAVHRPAPVDRVTLPLWMPVATGLWLPDPPAVLLGVETQPSTLLWTARLVGAQVAVLWTPEGPAELPPWRVRGRGLVDALQTRLEGVPTLEAFGRRIGRWRTDAWPDVQQLRGVLVPDPQVEQAWRRVLPAGRIHRMDVDAGVVWMDAPAGAAPRGLLEGRARTPGGPVAVMAPDHPLRAALQRAAPGLRVVHPGEPVDPAVLADAAWLVVEAAPAVSRAWAMTAASVGVATLTRTDLGGLVRHADSGWVAPGAESLVEVAARWTAEPAEPWAMGRFGIRLSRRAFDRDLVLARLERMLALWLSGPSVPWEGPAELSGGGGEARGRGEARPGPRQLVGRPGPWGRR
jgi:hypothetical protein